MERSVRTPSTVVAAGQPLHLGDAALPTLQRWLTEEGADGVPIILGDEHTLACCLPELLRHVPALHEAPVLQVGSGEASKDIGVCAELWGQLARLAADRRAVLVNLGGGVVTDLGGFVAATYKRGIRFINLPTTVMGMTDAAIGGKSAIDLNGVKNLVGSFTPPVATHVHPPFLRTLGKRELLNGVAEMLKHGLVRDAEHWQALLHAPMHDLDALSPLILRSAAIKAEVVSEDPLEHGPRKLLNFGHTIGHAMEAFSLESPGRSLLHGEAVAFGMVCAAWISHRHGLLDHADLAQVERALRALFPLPVVHSAQHHRILELMRNDKKNAGDGFRFTLLTGIGSACFDVPVDASEVRAALAHCGQPSTLPTGPRPAQA